MRLPAPPPVPDFHRLDPDADAAFLRRDAADPLSRVAFRPANAVVLCATCGLVSLRETWEACGGCPNGHPTAAAWDPAEAARAAGDGARTAAPAPPRAPVAVPVAPYVPAPVGEERPRRTGLWVGLGAGAFLLAALAVAALLNRDDAPETAADTPDAVAQPAAPQATVAEAGETEGALDDGDFRDADGYYQDLYAFAADSAGGALTFTVESESFYPSVRVTGPDGRETEAVTDGPEDASTDRRRVVVRGLRGGGPYRVLVSSRQPGAAGAYTLRIRQEDLVTALPADGRRVDGELTARSPRTGDQYRDTYGFQGAAGREHTVTVRTGAFTPTLVVTGPAGAVRLQSAPVSGGTAFRFTPDRAGAFRAVVSTQERGRTGAYSVALVLGPAPPAAAPAAAPSADAASGGTLRAGAAAVRDSLAAGDTRSYAASGRIGDRVSVEVRADGFTPTLTVVGPDGRRTPATPDGDRARVTVTLLSDGPFRVVVGSTGGAGAYSVSLEQRAAVTAAPIPRLPGADAPTAPPPAAPPAEDGGYRPQPLGGNN